MKAYGIIWDTDGEKIELPNEIDLPEGMTDEDDISDYLSDVTGFCHKGFLLDTDSNDADSGVVNEEPTGKSKSAFEMAYGLYNSDRITKEEYETLVEGIDNPEMTELRRRSALCTECMSETCLFNPEGLCMVPMLYGRAPGICDDECTDWVSSDK